MLNRECHYRNAIALIYLCFFWSNAQGWEDSITSHWPGELDTLDVLDSNHGEVRGNLDYTNGKIGDAFHLQGGGYLQIPFIENFEGNFTFHYWFNASLDRDIVLFRTFHKRGDTTVVVRPNGQICGRIQWRPGGCSFESIPGLFNSNTMTHVAISFKSSALKIYKNGVLVSTGSGAQPYPFDGAVFIGGDGKSDLGFHGLIDEIYYHNRMLTDQEIFDIYNQLTTNNPDPELQAQLENAYQEVDALQQQISELNATNTDLETQITELENQADISAQQIYVLEENIDTLESQVNQLENQIITLEQQVSGLVNNIGDLSTQLAELKQMVNSLELEVSKLELKVNQLQIELNTLKSLLSNSLQRIEVDFQQVFKDEYFEIPGFTPEEKLENLVDAIIALNKGRKMGLYQQLRNNQQGNKNQAQSWLLLFFDINYNNQRKKLK